MGFHHDQTSDGSRRAIEGSRRRVTADAAILKHPNRGPEDPLAVMAAARDVEPDA
jgi:hypothetical protein